MSRAIMLTLLLLATGPARAELPPLIPRQVLFGNPVKASPLVSPDGKQLAYLAPTRATCSRCRWLDGRPKVSHSRGPDQHARRRHGGALSSR